MINSRTAHQTPRYPDSIGSFALAYHLEMIRDRERVGRICAALNESLTPETIHCELGAGTGLFAIYAAQRCARVYAVERDPAVYAIAKSNIERSGVGDKIELILADACDFRPPERVDTVLAELLSIWCIDEPQVAVMNHAREHILRPGGRFLPSTVVNLVELGHYDFGIQGVSCPAVLPQFSGVTPPRIMTNSQVAFRLDFRASNPEQVRASVRLEALVGGSINCARLSSLVQFSPLVSFYTTDSLMPLTIVPINELAVAPGTLLEFIAECRLRETLDACNFSVSRVS